MVGKRIRVAREEMKLSQPDFGKMVKQSGATIRSWEKGDTSPRMVDMHRISSVTKKSIAWFLGIKDPAPNNSKRGDLAGTRGLVDPRGLTPGETAKMDAGYFQFQGRVIRASMVFEASGEPPRFGGYGGDEPGTDEGS